MAVAELFAGEDRMYGGDLHVDDVTYGPFEVPPRRERRGIGWTREEILDRIVRWNNIYGSLPTKRSWNITKLRGRLAQIKKSGIQVFMAIRSWEEGDWPSETTVRAHFGSLNAALAELGFEPRQPGRPRSETYLPPRNLPTGQDSLERLMDSIRKYRDHGQMVGLKEHLFALAETAIAEADKIRV